MLIRDSLARNSLLIMATTVINGGLGYGYWMLAARSRLFLKTMRTVSR